MPEISPIPKISVVTPSYNQGKFIEATIRSVLMQEYQNLEYIIIDGGSTDNTLEIVRQYEEYITYWVSEPDQGQSDALNKGFQRATGDILAWLCADDIYLPNALVTVSSYFQNYPNCQFIYGDGWKIDETGQPIEKFTSSPVSTLEELHRWCYVFTPGAFWRRSLWQSVGEHIDMRLHYVMDWDLMLRMAAQQMPVKISGEITAVRVHSASKTVMGVMGTDDKYKADRDREVVMVSREYGGVLCFNSIVYELKKLASWSNTFAVLPPIGQKIFRRVCYVPLLIFCALKRNPKSGLLNN
jgi:glycosyltransferase involved in cell wall biosynthesis